MGLVLAGLLLAAPGEAIVRLDGWVAASLHAQVTPAATESFVLVTELGSTVVLVSLVAAAAGLLTCLGRRRDATLLVLALVGAEALTWGLKALFRRERPALDGPIASPESFSYPSGHALTATAVYAALAFVAMRFARSRRSRTGWVAAAALLIGAIGLSRLYLGVHYLSDVVAGYCVGFAWLLVALEATGVTRHRAPSPT